MSKESGNSAGSSLRGNNSRYGTVARAFHWTCAVLFLFLLALGAWMTELDYYDKWTRTAISWHRSVGIMLFAIVLARLLWRLADRRPPPHPGLQAWERRLSISIHAYLLFVLVALPVTGYLFSGSKGDAIPLVAEMAVPSLMRIETEVAERIYDAHWFLAYSGLAAVFLHVSGGIKHAIEGKPEVLRRMIGGNRR